MVKITLAISKCYKNEGRFRTHRKRTKKAWKHYFLEEDEPNEYRFGTEWVDTITAQFLKLRKWHLRLFYCEQCLRRLWRYVKNDRMKVYCDYCPRDEEE